MDLKALVKSDKHQAVIEQVTATDSTQFTQVKSSPNPHAILDTRGVTLGYRYRIPEDLLKTLVKSTGQLPKRSLPIE